MLMCALGLLFSLDSRENSAVYYALQTFPTLFNSYLQVQSQLIHSVSTAPSQDTEKYLIRTQIFRETNNTGYVHKANKTGCVHKANNTGCVHKANNTGYVHKANNTGYVHKANNTGYVHKANNTGYAHKGTSYMTRNNTTFVPFMGS